MSVIASPKSIATRGRLVDIEDGSILQAALVLNAETRGRLEGQNLAKSCSLIYIPDNIRTMQIQQNRLEVQHVG